jgi:hypothetical protein
LIRKVLPSLGKTCIILAIFALSAAVGGAGEESSEPSPTAIDRAFGQLYNFDFQGSLALLDTHLRTEPSDPLAFALRAATYLFTEYNRLQILQTDFFSDNDKVTDKKRLKPDPSVRGLVFTATAEARKQALARLASHPSDRESLFALSMAAGVETEYTIMIEKKYLRSYNLAKETQGYARKLLTLNPPCYDAYVTLGSAEYVVANLNFFFRLFAHFDGIEGSRLKAIANLKEAIAYGRYYSPYAKILLAVVYLREKQIGAALLLMQELERDYPENPVFKSEVQRLSKRVADASLRGGRK